MTTFGEEWTRTLLHVCAELRVPPEWVLAVIALESGFDPLVTNRYGYHGLFQMGHGYSQNDPLVQLNDYRNFTRAMVFNFRTGPFTSREALYCCNLAPARLRDGAYSDETVLYQAPSQAYAANAAAFGKDPRDPRGALLMRDLAVGLDAGIRRNRARYDAELEEANTLNVAT